MKSFVKQENLASTLNVYKFNHYNNDISLNDSPTCESCPLINPNLKTQFHQITISQKMRNYGNGILSFLRRYTTQE